MKSIINILNRKNSNPFKKYLERNKLTAKQREKSTRLFKKRMLFLIFICVILTFFNLLESCMNGIKNNRLSKYYDSLEVAYNDGNVIKNWIDVQILANAIAKSKVNLANVESSIVEMVKSKNSLKNGKVLNAKVEEDILKVILEFEGRNLKQIAIKKEFEVDLKYDFEIKEFSITKIQELIE